MPLCKRSKHTRVQEMLKASLSQGQTDRDSQAGEIRSLHSEYAGAAHFKGWVHLWQCNYAKNPGAGHRTQDLRVWKDLERRGTKEHNILLFWGRQFKLHPSLQTHCRFPGFPSIFLKQVCKRKADNIYIKLSNTEPR